MQLTLAIILIIITPSFLYGATYTVCGSGCDYTTIGGAIAGVDLGDDDIVEVRADTEGGSKTYTENIDIGTADGGSSGHPVVFQVRSGDTVIIDGNDVNDHVVAISGSYITFDGFKIINPGFYAIRVFGANASSKATGVTIQNCTIEIGATANTSNSLQGVAVLYGKSITIYNNTVTVSADDNPQQSDGYYIQASDTIDINKNTYITASTAPAAHNDCVQVAGGNGTIPYDSTGTITVRNNVCIHNNSITSYRQFMYFEYEIQGNLIVYNNVCYKPSASGSHGIYRLTNGAEGTSGSVYFYNNSVYIGGAAASCYSTNVADTTIMGNICYINDSGSGAMIYLTAEVASEKIDYNFGYKPGGTNNYRRTVPEDHFYTFATWQELGYDTHGSWVNPNFNNVSEYPYDLSLQSSTAIDALPTLSAPTGVFTVDILGLSRPQGSAWDIGAYEYLIDTTAPADPAYTINTAGSSFTVTFAERVTHGAGGTTGWVLTSDGGAVTATYSSGEGSTALVYQLSRTVYSTETVTGTYTQPGNGIEDTAGNDFATVTDVAITNNSTATATVSRTTLSAGSNVTLSPSGTGSFTLAP